MTNGFVRMLEHEDGSPIIVYARYVNSKDRLVVWRTPVVEKMIRDHIMKPGNNEKTLIEAMTKWYQGEIAKGDDMRSAWAEDCCNKFHKVQERMFPPRQLDLFEGL